MIRPAPRLGTRACAARHRPPRWIRLGSYCLIPIRTSFSLPDPPSAGEQSPAALLPAASGHPESCPYRPWIGCPVIAAIVAPGRLSGSSKAAAVPGGVPPRLRRPLSEAKSCVGGRSGHKGHVHVGPSLAQSVCSEAQRQTNCPANVPLLVRPAQRAPKPINALGSEKCTRISRA